MKHPHAIDLEALAAGEVSPPVVEHVESCALCMQYVERARGLVNAGPVVRLDVSELARDLDLEHSTELRSGAAALTAPRSRAGMRSWGMVATLTGAMAAAAAVVLWVHPWTGSSERSAPVAMAPPSPSLVEGPPSEPDTRFKGSMQVAVIRERGDGQVRFAGPLRVKPGDRLRVEVALDRQQDILGAVLGEDGSYLELMPAGVRDAGTHFSELSARVDANPLRGVILVGAPGAIARARVTRNFDGLVVVPIDWETP